MLVQWGHKMDCFLLTEDQCVTKFSKTVKFQVRDKPLHFSLRFLRDKFLRVHRRTGGKSAKQATKENNNKRK